MYKKAISGLLLGNLILLAGAFCIEGIEWNTAAAVPAFEMKLDEAVTADHKSSAMGVVYRTASGQRVVDCGVLAQAEEELIQVAAEGATAQADVASQAEMLSNGARGVTSAQSASELVYQLCEEDYDILLRIVEAEAGGEDEDGKLLVANVVLNRVNNEQFPDTVSEVVQQQSKGVTQFSPVATGSIWKVTISQETIDAVQRALEGEDISQGALYFAARKYADKDRMRWFDENLTFLFSHGGHEFFM